MEVCCTASCFGSPSSRGRQAQARRQQQNSCLATARDIIIRLAANCFARESPSSRRRQINPPEIADSQHGSPAERYDQGRLVEKRWGTSSNTNERPRNRQHCVQHPPFLLIFSQYTHIHSLTTPSASPTNTTTTTHTPRGKQVLFLHQPRRHHRQHSIYSPRAPPKPHPAHTHTRTCLPCQKVAAPARDASTGLGL